MVELVRSGRSPEDLDWEFEPSVDSQLGVPGGSRWRTTQRRADELGEKGVWAAAPWESAAEAGAL